MGLPFRSFGLVLDQPGRALWDGPGHVPKRQGSLRGGWSVPRGCAVHGGAHGGALPSRRGAPHTSNQRERGVDTWITVVPVARRSRWSVLRTAAHRGPPRYSLRSSRKMCTRSTQPCTRGAPSHCLRCQNVAGTLSLFSGSHNRRRERGLKQITDNVLGMIARYTSDSGGGAEGSSPMFLPAGAKGKLTATACTIENWVGRQPSPPPPDLG